jgi:C4-dicarboxylate transporter DctM subunit
VLLHGANTSAMLLYIITNAILFNFLLTSEQIPQALAQWVTHMHLEPWQFLVIVNLTLLLAGQFMEPSSIILILAPLFLPIAQALGIDPIHLGIVMTVNMEIGMLTPPVGLNLYVASHLSHMGLTTVSRAALPFVGVMLVYLMLITYVPEISLWLVHLLYPSSPTPVPGAAVFD